MDEYRVAIKELSDERQAVYNDVKAMATEPQRVDITRPKNAIIETARRQEDGSKVQLPTRTTHLLVDNDGNYPIGRLNGWEVEVLDKELGRPGSVAWYRNPARASQDSLGVAYQDANSAWRSLRPDFLFFSRGSDGIEVSIVDPHSHHLADALPKLKGLARFASQYGKEFHRIEAVSKVGEQLRVLDLMSKPVRDAVLAADEAEVLYGSPIAGNY